MHPNFSINDLVTYFGQIIGRIEYVRGGWAGVRCGDRVDEYRADLLFRAK